MGLNQSGKNQLKADLILNAIHYNQNRFGVIKAECGTEACMAGMCLMRKIGLPAFTARVQEDSYSSGFIQDCLSAAAEQLGLSLLGEWQYEEAAEEQGMETDGLPPIFGSASYWPEDLQERYEAAEERHDHVAMAEVACEALDRMDEEGFID